MLINNNPAAMELSQRKACEVLELCRNTLRQQHKTKTLCGPLETPKHSRKHAKQPKALSAAERETVLNTLNSESFCNQPPVEVYHSLLEQGQYLCSVSTMHRILRDSRLNGERRKQRPAQSHSVPRLRATRVHEVWTWDIAKLPTKKRGEYLSLYVILDLYSRRIISWMLSHKENSALSSQLIQSATHQYDIPKNSLTIHQDRGVPMTAHCYLDLLGELAVTASHSRPRVSNDNPMSEAQFKTLKYQPDFPRRFDNYSHARKWCQDYVAWYNNQHHHSGLAGFTPEQVFTGEYKTIATIRQTALDKAYEQNPERFSKGKPMVSMPPKVVEINPVTETDDDYTAESGVNFPTLPRAMANAI